MALFGNRWLRIEQAFPSVTHANRGPAWLDHDLDQHETVVDLTFPLDGRHPQSSAGLTLLQVGGPRSHSSARSTSGGQPLRARIRECCLRSWFVRTFLSGPGWATQLASSSFPRLGGTDSIPCTGDRTEIPCEPNFSIIHPACARHRLRASTTSEEI